MKLRVINLQLFLLLLSKHLLEFLLSDRFFRRRQFIIKIKRLRNRKGFVLHVQFILIFFIKGPFQPRQLINIKRFVLKFSKLKCFRGPLRVDLRLLSLRL